MKGITGLVFSAKMPLTAVVQVKRFYHFPLYGKIITRKGKIHAHNAIGAKQGQRVEIIPCRPYAKTVAFEITKIISSAKPSNLSNSTNSANLTNEVTTKTKSKSKQVIKTKKTK